MTVLRLTLCSILALLASAPGAVGQAADHSMHQSPAAPAAMAPARSGNDSLPAGEEQARAALEKSPRHGEWQDVKIAGSDETVRTWVVYPERKDQAPVVIVIHEIFGLTDWIRAVADQLARDGFIAVAPDLLTGKGPGGGNTDAFGSRDEVTKAVRGLTPEETRRRLDAVRQYAISLPAANGRSATVGFCWGGSTSFRYASEQPQLDAAVVYYGSAPDEAAIARLKVPVLGLYGGDDARVNATIAPATAAVKRVGGTYETEIYDGAGHGFLRNQTGREGANARATERAWPRMLEFLRTHTK